MFNYVRFFFFSFILIFSFLFSFFFSFFPAQPTKTGKPNNSPEPANDFKASAVLPYARTETSAVSEHAHTGHKPRGIQLGSGGKDKRKEKPFDLCKKAAVIKQIQLATYAEDRKSCWRRNYKQVRANSHITPLSNYRKFLVPKTFDAWMYNLCNFPEFSFGVHVQPGQTWPQFLIVII